MFSKASVCLVVICLPFIFIGNSWGHCQSYWTAEYKCLMGCIPCAGGAGEPPAVPAGPTQEELRQQHEAKDLNEAAEDAEDKGDEANRKGNWENAARYFKDALEYAPDDQNIRAKLSKAQQKMDEAAAATAVAAKVEAQSQQDVTVLKGGDAFGDNVVKLKGSENADAPIANAGSSKPGSQLKTTEYHGKAAQAGNPEVAHSQAGKGFDTLGENRGTQAIRPQQPDHSAAALAAKIPAQAWDKDPQIGQLYGDYKNLSAIKQETLASIADLKQRQKSGKEDPAVAAAQLSMLNTRLKDTNKDMTKTEKTIKVHVVNLGLDWGEGATGSATDQKTKGKK